MPPLLVASSTPGIGIAVALAPPRRAHPPQRLLVRRRFAGVEIRCRLDNRLGEGRRVRLFFVDRGNPGGGLVAAVGEIGSTGRCPRLFVGRMRTVSRVEVVVDGIGSGPPSRRLIIGHCSIGCAALTALFVALATRSIVHVGAATVRLGTIGGLRTGRRFGPILVTMVAALGAAGFGVLCVSLFYCTALVPRSMASALLFPAAVFELLLFADTAIACFALLEFPGFMLLPFTISFATASCLLFGCGQLDCTCGFAGGFAISVSAACVACLVLCACACPCIWDSIGHDALLIRKPTRTVHTSVVTAKTL